jgi:hypothetical protein
MFASPNTRNGLVDVDQQRVRFLEDKEFPPKYHSAKVTTAAVTTVITSVLTTSIGFAGVS